MTDPPIEDKDESLSAWDDTVEWWKESHKAKDPFDVIREWERWKLFAYPASSNIKNREELDFYLRKTDNNLGVVYAMVVIAFMLVVACFTYLKYYFEERSENSRNSLHCEVSANDSRRIPASRRSQAAINSNNTVVDVGNASANASDKTDQPPRYDAVVQDYLSGKGEFPEVHSFQSEIPPPNYDQCNHKRY